ncbi:MAG: TIGR01777 family oxidoreductase [Opitutales bacterium]|nr:TIGR01777 family oxidoreductase [Opitutales bacterium]
MKTALITGASGLLGKALSNHLIAEGWTVRSLGRGPEGPGKWHWDPEKAILPVEALAGCDAVVHLAGESLVGRWTAAKRERIMQSRVQGTRLLAARVASMERPPSVLISASGAHRYPADGAVQDENSGEGEGFLATVCSAWEDAAKPVEAVGTRLVNLRTGMVVSKYGGALAQMLTPFKFGLGGPLGDGQQWMSWIELSDWCHLVTWAIKTESVTGPLNAVSPEPVRQKAFAKALGNQLNRRAILPVPAFMIRLAMGQMGEEMLLSSLRVLPAKALANDFKFKAASIETALSKSL